MGGGDDIFTFSASTGTVNLNGGAGDDTLTGTATTDTLNGGDGDDRLIGARGNDTMDGGNNADVLVWNNGDGTDTMNGNAGADEVEVNGAPNAGDQFRITAAGAQDVRFDRINLGLFGLNISTSERITVNGLGGNDDIRADETLGNRILMTANGGTGDDAVVGSPNADLITGGDDIDTLSGAGGDDRIVGDRGNDTMNGGTGDDTTVWNNGDGTDVMNGDAGSDRVEVNGAPGAGDVFTIAPNGARAKFDRTNLGPFSLDIGSAEALDANGLGGDDDFTALPGISSLLAINADGGAGNDALDGAEGDDTLLGGSGNDAINPGGGSDVADGGEGDDTLLGRDGQTDLLRCGTGTDSAQTDLPGVDALTGCETVDALTPAPIVTPPANVPGAAAPVQGDTTATPVQLGAFSAAKRAGRQSVRFTVTCPAGETGGCSGELRLTTASAVVIGGVKVRVLVGTARYTLRPGQRQTRTIKLPAGVERLAGKGRQLRLIAAAVTRDASGNVAESSTRRSVKLAK
ncbi:hypothetical protein LRS13_04670 [Svornostia abyssi]|uniref:Alkaline phosphatase n=1 Tax=Svornostia abyssi TaxID=2898438 RepID=A0ABY5PJT9_9ACTN|nr:hypothetical protein LRS13_04670 [Parviterribacteraceae bacterium J379]